MSAALKKIEGEAMMLTARARARLAERLIASLDQEPADPNAEKLWIAEAQRRADDLASEKFNTVSADFVLKPARGQLGPNRNSNQG